MSVRGFLMWYIGAVVFVGTAGASGYQALMRLHAQNAAETRAATPSEAPIAMAETPPPPAASAPSPAVESPPPAASTPAEASPSPNRPPPLREHVAAATEPALRAGKGAAEQPGVAQGRVHHRPAPATTMAQRQSPGYPPRWYVAPGRPGVWYPPPPPAPPVTS